MKIKFAKDDSTTMGIRLNIEDYEKITQLAKKYNLSKGTIARKIINVALKEMVELK